jgi:2-methylcitrate dehydratase PrpD
MGHAKWQEVAYLTACHPGVTVIRAALAAADGSSISGTDLPTTLVPGYQTQCAITNRYSRLSNARALRSSPIDSVFGASMAAAKLMGLDEASFTLALGLAETFASGTFESRGGGMISILQVAQAARNRVFAAAALARNGATASAFALKGEHGFYRAFTGSEPCDLIAYPR